MSQNIPFRFNPLKSAQAVAFLLKLHGGEMSKYITLKMIYLADREALKRWNISITGDTPASMPLGPVPSSIYDLTKENQNRRFSDIWNPIIKTRTAEILEINSDPGTDELSGEEMDLLYEIYEKFKGFNFGAMKNFCHDLGEYDKSVCDAPKGSRSKPIKIETLLKSIGKTPEEITGIEKYEREIRLLENAFRK